MHSPLGLVGTLTAALGLSLVLGYLATRARLPALVGYLLAGFLIGPGSPGLVADVQLTSELADVGIMLMMFGVGLHFSLRELFAVRRVALPGAAAQMVVTTGAGLLVGRLWGLDPWGGFILGASLSIASTVVVLRTLEASEGGLTGTPGRIAVGWLIVQDLLAVLLLVLLPTLAGGRGSVWTSLGVTLAKLGAFALLVVLVARRGLPRLLWSIAGTGSRELFTLGVISAALGIAYLSALYFNVSIALGAFVAGVIMGESELSTRAADESLPLRDAFAVLFFVSVGMLFDPRVVLDEPGRLAAVMALILIVNQATAVAVVLAARYPLTTALTVGASLAQIGEFSFILASVGAGLGLLTGETRSLIVAGALLSIVVNPWIVRGASGLGRWLRTRSGTARALEHRDDPLAGLPASVDPRTVTGHVVLVGFGRVGARIGDALLRHRVAFVVAEQDRGVVEALRARGVHAITGDGGEEAVLVQAHVARARLLIVAIPDPVTLQRMVRTAQIGRAHV